MQLSERIKFYEKNCTPSQLVHVQPILVRLDGKCFHSFTRKLQKPYDEDLNDAMDETAHNLAEETNARCAFVQSDEISLLYYSDSFDSQVFMNAKRDKINSILSSMCAIDFNRYFWRFTKHKRYDDAYFDCRCWNVPSKKEAVNYFIWRQEDAIRNSIQMLGQHYFSHNQLHKKNSAQIQEMLFQEHNINWNDCKPRFKRGVFIQRRKIVRPFTSAEIDKLPEKHAARLNLELKVQRTEYDYSYEELSKVVPSREGFIFEGEVLCV